MNNLKFIKLLALSIISFSCATNNDDYIQAPLQTDLKNKIDAIYGSKKTLILPDSDSYASIPKDAKNSITDAKVELGKFLFHETLIGKDSNKEEGMGTYSCASCHHTSAGFQSGLLQGIGDGGIGFGDHGEARVKSPNYLEADLDVQPIKTPSILNTAYQSVMLWNGQLGATGFNRGTEDQWVDGTPAAKNNLGFGGLETQAIAALGLHRLMIDNSLIENTTYKALFDAAFPNIAEQDRCTTINAGLAIAAYERTVLSNEAPFQKWLKGDEFAMSDAELKGAILFFDKGQCYNCHSGPGLNGMDFYALAVNDLQGDNVMTVIDEATKKGRGSFTKNTDDDYKFKVPQLYNLKDVNFYGHGGSFTSVKEIISYKNKAIPENSEVPSNKISPLFKPLNLTEEEVDLITVFVEDALYDPNLIRYQPTSLPSGNCMINADPQSSLDMGCN
ncbi:cytochrome-c peroxidase [Thalassobellus citreus]|uniref:cytochrome-c peroxidase n=1 Tax=Thalassobellus citreus TaxID=3367752 RepID=UPI0037A436BE